MKNSLFKRAIAAAATVPLALSQCLTYSFAVTADDTAAPAAIADDSDSSASITLDKLLYIAPSETKSNWNGIVASAIARAINSGNTTGTIETSSIINTVASKAGSYSELASAVLGQVTDVKYVIASNGDITITANVNNISEALSNDFEKSLGNAVKKLADGYDVPELNDVDFTTVDASGSIKIVVAASQLNAGTEVPVTFEFAPSEGGSLGTSGVIQYAKDKIGEYRQIAYDKIDSVAAQEIDLDTTGAKAEIDKAFNNYINMLNKAERYVNKAVSFSLDQKLYGNVENVIAAANKRLAKVTKKTIPATGAEIASNAAVKSVYDTAIAQLNKAAAPYTVDIELSEIGAFLDSLTSVEAGAANGTYTLTGQFEDAEADAVAAYYNSNPDLGDYVSSYKIFTGSVDLSAAKGTNASVDVEIERVVVTTDKVTTTTTTTTTTTSDTTTTTSDTTTTTSDTTTTTSDTTTTTSDTTTTTSDTTTTTSDTTTTTSDTTTTTTTTSAIAVEVNRYAEVEADYGFYLDIDKEFNKGQIESAKLHVLYNDVAVDEDGLEILDEDGNAIVLKEYEDVTDILGDVDFGDNTPGNTYTKENETFLYNVPVSYEGEELTDADGNVITVEAYIGIKGDADLDNDVDSADATGVLRYYTLLSSGEGGVQVDPYTLKLSVSALVASPTSVYDEFVAFLCDVRCDLSDNWNKTKADRVINPSDATSILRYYTLVMSNREPGEALWNEVFGE